MGFPEFARKREAERWLCSACGKWQKPGTPKARTNPETKESICKTCHKREQRGGKSREARKMATGFKRLVTLLRDLGVDESRILAVLKVLEDFFAPVADDIKLDPLHTIGQAQWLRLLADSAFPDKAAQIDKTSELSILSIPEIDQDNIDTTPDMSISPASIDTNQKLSIAPPKPNPPNSEEDDDSLVRWLGID
jgi:hypothetical protein